MAVSATTRARSGTCARKRKHAGLTRPVSCSPADCRYDDHLARHRLADLFLDTLPYNAHTTASDALWTGLPVLTCEGTAFAGRVAASLLYAVGLPELVTHSIEDYEALALRLGERPLTSRRISPSTGGEPADASLVRHRPLPTPHRGGLSPDVGDLAARRAPRSFAVERNPQDKIYLGSIMKNKSQFRSGRKPLQNVSPTRSPELSSAFGQALALHQAGRLAEAETNYIHVLKRNPIILIVCTCSVSFIINGVMMQRQSTKSTLP